MSQAGVTRRQLVTLEQKISDPQYALVGDDLVIDQKNTAPSDRDKGLTRTTFRRWPGVLFGPDWQQRVVAAAMAEKAKRAA